MINNVGSGGGQVIFHLHWHLLAKAAAGFDIEGGPDGKPVAYYLTNQ